MKYTIKVNKEHTQHLLIKSHQTNIVHSFNNYYGILCWNNNLELSHNSIYHHFSDIVWDKKLLIDLLDIIARIETDVIVEDEGYIIKDAAPYEQEMWNDKKYISIGTYTVAKQNIDFDKNIYYDYKVVELEEDNIDEIAKIGEYKLIAVLTKYGHYEIRHLENGQNELAGGWYTKEQVKERYPEAEIIEEEISA